jgi:hypothetical protein
MKRLGVVLLFSMTTFPSAPLVFAQTNGNVPAIRVEAHEVLVPTGVLAKCDGCKLVHHLNLSATDFHLFEDGKEQKIQKVILMRFYETHSRDNLGMQLEYALTPKGKWKFLLDRTRFGGTSDFYVLAYVPPPSAQGSCHQIKVKVDPHDATGSRFVAAEEDLGTPEGHRTERVQVDRHDLFVVSRTEYCNTEHSSSDPLNGTKVSKRMESYAPLARAAESGLSLQASSFYTEPGSARIHVALDFPSIGPETGLLSFTISLLGMAYRNEGGVAARFTDTSDAGCAFLSHKVDPLTFPAQVCRELIPKHYETQLNLPPGDYDLRVVIDYNGRLRRAQVPVTVDNYDGKHVALSGIALCNRFHERHEQEQNSVPTMPFEFVSLVSKGIEFTPAGDTRFNRGEPLIAFFEVYEPLLAGTGSANVQVQMRVTEEKTGELKVDTGLRSAESWMRPANPVIPIAQEIAIDKLPPGTYRLEVQASDSAGNHTAWRATSFTVE